MMLTDRGSFTSRVPSIGPVTLLGFAVLSVIVFFFSFPQSARAIPLLTIDETVGKYDLGGYLEILEDPLHQWDLEQVQAPENANHFKPASQSSLNLGFTASRYWVRFQVTPEMHSSQHWYLELAYPHLDQIQLYGPQSEGQQKIVRAGDHFLFYQRDFKYRNFVFPLDLSSQAPQTYYLAVTTSGSMRLPLTLWSPERFAEKVHQEEILFGLYYGAMLVMLLYHLLLFLGVRDRIYLDYSLFLGAFTFFQLTLNGYAFQYLWQERIWWAHQSLPILLNVTVLVALQFTKVLLYDENFQTRGRTLIRWMLPLSALSTLSSLVLNYSTAIKIATVLGSTTAIIMLLLGIQQSFRRHRNAYFYTIANMAFLVGAGVLGLVSLGWLPQTFITTWSLQIGSVLQAVLFSLGVADRFNLMKREKDLAQARTLEIQKNANEQLEEKVDLRTRELQQANQEISILNEELRGYLQETKSKEHIIRRKNEIFQYLLATSTAVHQADGLEELFHHTILQMENLFETLRFGLILDGPRSQIIECAAFPRISKEEQDVILLHNDQLLNVDLKQLFHGKKTHPNVEEPLQNWFVLPMIGPEYQVMGKLIIKGPAVEHEDKKIINLFLEQIAALAKNKLLTRELAKLANTDPLTGTFNRGYFDRESEKAIANSSQFQHVDFSIIMIDVNGLKAVNDCFGHSKGDEIIIQVAEMLKSVCRKSDVLTRFGGDEFVILCHGSDYQQTQRLIDRIREQEQHLSIIAPHPESQQEVLPIRLSIGVASSEDIHPDDVMKIADERMYEDKKAYYEKNEHYRDKITSSSVAS